MQHLPWWSLVLVVCVCSPFLIRAWIHTERKRSQLRTQALIQQLQSTKTTET